MQGPRQRPKWQAFLVVLWQKRALQAMPQAADLWPERWRSKPTTCTFRLLAPLATICLTYIVADFFEVLYLTLLLPRCDSLSV